MNKRIKRFKKILKAKKLDGFIVTNPFNIFYLTGFRGVSPQEREAILPISSTRAVLITARLYQQEARLAELASRRSGSRLALGSDKGNLTFHNVSHLQIVPNKLNQKNYLLICIDSLYEDFEKAILTYRDKLNSTKSLQRKWRTAVNAICKPR